jgi:hypothetical protein
MIDFYDQTMLTNLNDFLTFMIRNSFTFGEPVQADYRSTGLFNPDSIFLPTVRELNELLDTALEGDNLVVYLALVRALPSTMSSAEPLQFRRACPKFRFQEAVPLKLEIRPCSLLDLLQSQPGSLSWLETPTGR